MLRKKPSSAMMGSLWYMGKNKIRTSAKQFQNTECGILSMKNGNALMNTLKLEMIAFLYQNTHIIIENRKSLTVCQDTLKLKEAVENHMRMKNGLLLWGGFCASQGTIELEMFVFNLIKTHFSTRSQRNFFAKAGSTWNILEYVMNSLPKWNTTTTFKSLFANKIIMKFDL